MLSVQLQYFDYLDCGATCAGLNAVLNGALGGVKAVANLRPIL